MAASNPAEHDQPLGHDLDAMRSLVDANTRLVFIANPNNPTGTWVELLDGSVGVVCAQHETWPLTPQVAVMMDKNGKPLHPGTIIADKSNPIVSARQPDEQRPDAPDLEAIA